MPLDTPDDTPEVISVHQFERERDALWKNLNPMNNPKREIITKTFSVEKAEPGSRQERLEIFESASPDIHIVTNRCENGDGAYFSVTVNSKGGNNVLRIDTDDTSLAGEIHQELVAKFEETRAVKESLVWLVEHSKYAQRKGKRLQALVMVSF